MGKKDLLCDWNLAGRLTNWKRWAEKRNKPERYEDKEKTKRVIHWAIATRWRIRGSYWSNLQLIATQMPAPEWERSLCHLWQGHDWLARYLLSVGALWLSILLLFSPSTVTTSGSFPRVIRRIHLRQAKNRYHYDCGGRFPTQINKSIGIK